jgi:hypothetical protein
MLKQPQISIIIPVYNNEGVAKARNAGLKYATGDFIIFVDTDESSSVWGEELPQIEPEYGVIMRRRYMEMYTRN